jgi:hypothetical protein
MKWIVKLIIINKEHKKCIKDQKFEKVCKLESKNKKSSHKYK